MQLHIKNKYTLLIPINILDNKINNLFLIKKNILQHLKDKIKLNDNTSNKIYIKLNDKLVSIQSLNKGDRIVISDNISSKNALIL